MTGASVPVRRVYLPVGPDGVAALAAGSAMQSSHRRGFAVTAVVRAAFPDQDDEELEYEALCVAAESAVAPAGPGPLRGAIVVAVDLPANQLADVSDPDATTELAPYDAYAVTVSSAVTTRQVVSVHVQEDPHDPDSELAWYDVSELPVIARRLR